MTLLKELIDIPERVQRGDFVLRLSEGVTRPEETLRDYVVTPELRGCFDNALSFIKSAVDSRTSKATYLHGSFGSGKSHFMAVLHLLLQGNTAARSIVELAPVVVKHNPWTEGKKFLLVPYHMIGSRDMESGILGGYVEFIRRTHPEAPIPGVYLAEGLFDDALELRETMGDGAFFGRLNADASDETGWGDLDAQWDASRFDAAIAQPPGAELRSLLIGALMRTFFRSYDVQASGRGEAFVSLDRGLSIISKHAAALGYHGLILFLDELVLWLAGHAADLGFVQREGQKLAKLVESQTADRPIPIISFVARQRDLRELIGDAIPGAERLNFGDSLKHWEDRFHKINLEDRNLPAIAERRVLKVRHEAARSELDRAFERTAAMRESVMNILLTREGDRAMFRKVYPFSPALVQTLIAVSSVLQRERTALKVMVQLLVDHRETLRVGDIVPVGDLFDVIAHGDEAFSPETAIHFENAKRLYHNKLLPLLEKQYGAKEDLDLRPADDKARVGFRNDDRLIKTLLLAALVPGVESLATLNCERLAALNHGTIVTPIPGRESQEVLRRCREWAGVAGEIRVGEGTNPAISIELSGVDTEAIIKQAEREDNFGNRIRRVREMIFDAIKIKEDVSTEHQYDFEWKRTKRSCIVLFKNIRDLSDSSLENLGDDWKLIIDFPFDEHGRGPRDDISRIQTFQASHPSGAKTICWVPSFFSKSALEDLGLLVIHDHLLSGDRLEQYSRHLSLQDRQTAKQILENRRSMLVRRVKDHIDAAYGLTSGKTDSLDPAHELEQRERFISLRLGFDPSPPASVNLAGAMSQLVSQALAHEFPAAPEFGIEPKLSNLKKTADVLLGAARADDGRQPVEKGPLREIVRGIVEPLRLGEMGLDATHFVLGHHWRTHFMKKSAEHGGDLEVGKLRKWIDEPKPMGLSKEVANLIILTYAQQTGRGFYFHGGPVGSPGVGDLLDAYQLREARLPDQAVWDHVVARMGPILGKAPSTVRNAANLTLVESELRRWVDAYHDPMDKYLRGLEERIRRFGIAPDSSDRLRTAIAASNMLRACRNAPGDGILEAFSAAKIATSEAAMGETVKSAGRLLGSLERTEWEIIESLRGLDPTRKAEAEAILGDVSRALQMDEHVCALAFELATAQAKAVKLLVERPIRNGDEHRKVEEDELNRPFHEGSAECASIDEARERLAEVAGKLDENSKVHVTITWRVVKKG